MKQITIPSQILMVMLLIASLGFTACQKDISGGQEISSGSSENEATASTSENSATASTANIDLDLADFGGFPHFIECANGGAGETILSQGIVKQLTHLTINGNHFTMRLQFTPQGVISIGQITGDLYHGTGNAEFTQTGSFVNGQATFSSVWMFTAIGPGNLPTFKMIPTVHTTVNASGTVTSSIDKVVYSCQ